MRNGGHVTAFVDAPDTVDTLAHIPPANLTDVIGPVPASLKVYDADAGGTE